MIIVSSWDLSNLRVSAAGQARNVWLQGDVKHYKQSLEWARRYAAEQSLQVGNNTVVVNKLDSDFYIYRNGEYTDAVHISIFGKVWGHLQRPGYKNTHNFDAQKTFWTILVNWQIMMPPPVLVAVQNVEIIDMKRG